MLASPAGACQPGRRDVGGAFAEPVTGDQCGQEDRVGDRERELRQREHRQRTLDLVE